MNPMLITNALLVDAAGTRNGWLRTDGKVITAVGTGDNPQPQPGEEHVDAREAMLMPGLVDTHVHFREPGLEEKGTIASESRAARLGGMAMVFDMPNTKPATTTAVALVDKLARGRATSEVHYRAFYGATPACLADLRSLDASVPAGVKIFLGTSTGAMHCPDEAELLDIMRYCADAGLTVMVHAEDDAMIAANAAAAVERYGSREAVPVSEHSLIRSREACLAATSRAIDLALRTGVHLHVAHVSTADELSLFQLGPVEGKQITAETTPLYLDPVLSVPSCRTNRHKVNPAIKTEADAEALREALANGRIDTLGTDHAPHLLSQKEGGALTAASGAPSVQFALVRMLQYLEPQLIVQKMAQAPFTIFGMGRYGLLEPGMPAWLILVEKTEPYTITDSMVVSPCGWTPFEGLQVSHRIVPLSI